MRRALGILLAALLAVAPGTPLFAASATSDDQAPEIVDVAIDKSILKPGDIGTYTIRIRDDNPPETEGWFNWLPSTPIFEWSEETTRKLNGGKMVAGSLRTSDDGVTSFQVKFEVLPDAPYGSYAQNYAMVISDSIGNYTHAVSPSFVVDDPQHPIDNEPAITGKRMVGETLEASLNAPGARVEWQWTRRFDDPDKILGTQSKIFLKTDWFWSILQVRAIVTWPDGHTLVRRAYTDYLEGIPVDIGSISFDPAPAVGVQSTAKFIPNPSLPFKMPPTEVLLLSSADIDTSTGTFTPFPQDAGKQVYARLSYQLPRGYYATSSPEARATIATGVWRKGPPVVSGTPEVGRTLSAKPGNWSGSPEGFFYQWLRNGKPIPGEEAPTYEVKPQDANASISVRTTAFWPNWTHRFTATSDPVTVRKGILPNLRVQLQGTPKVGQKVSANASNWFDGTQLSYQWLRNGRSITGATKSSYALGPADSSNKLSVKVTANRPGYTSTSTTSASKTVLPGTLAKGRVQVTGTHKVGQNLTGKTSAWPTGAKLSYQWLKNGKSIKGASSVSYKLSAADRAAKISLRVTASKHGYVAISVTSTGKAIAAGTITKGSVKLAGTARVGYTLTAKPSGWTSGSTFKYQWLKNGYSIKGATGSKYKVQTKDRRAKISVRVHATKTGYTTSSHVTSARYTVR